MKTRKLMSEGSRKDISDVQVLQAYEAYNADRSKWPYQILQEQTGLPFKVCYRAIERAADRRLLDYGVSLRSGWITEKGKALLQQEDKSL